MTDDGHDLPFGALLTPTSSPAQQRVALAQLSKQLGLDVVTFQDHPRRPAAAPVKRPARSDLPSRLLHYSWALGGSWTNDNDDDHQFEA